MVSARSSDCTEGAGSGVSQLGGMGGDSNRWSGEGGGEGEAEFGFRWSRKGSGAGLKLVDISEGKNTEFKITKLLAHYQYNKSSNC